MKKSEYAKRFITALFGVLLVSLGVALSAKSALGTTPIAAIPFTIAHILTLLSFGEWLIIYHIPLIVTQIVIYKRKTDYKSIIMQFIITFVFGYATDFWMFILQSLNPENYILRLLTLFIACIILAMGAFLGVVSRAFMLPGDGFVLSIADKIKKPFGKIRVISDVSMAAIAALLGLIVLHKFVGVREGTIIAALLIGNIIKLYNKWFSDRISAWLSGSAKK